MFLSLFGLTIGWWLFNTAAVVGQYYYCDDGCDYLASYQNDGYCDCPDCSDEDYYTCETCPGCPSSCGYYVLCSSNSDTGSDTGSYTGSYTGYDNPCDDYETTGCDYVDSFYNDNYCDCPDCSDEPYWSCSSCYYGCPTTCSSYQYCYQSAGSYDPDDTPCPSSTLDDGFQIGDVLELAQCAEAFCESDGAVGVLTRLVSELGGACDAIGAFNNIINLLTGNGDDVDPAIGIVATCWESETVDGARANFTSFANYLEYYYDVEATQGSVASSQHTFTEYYVGLDLINTAVVNANESTFVNQFTSLNTNNYFISAIYDSTGTTKAEMISAAITDLILDLTDKMEIGSVIYNWTDEDLTRVVRSDNGVLFIHNDVGDRDYQFFMCEANIVENGVLSLNDIKHKTMHLMLLEMISIAMIFIF